MAVDAVLQVHALREVLQGRCVVLLLRARQTARLVERAANVVCVVPGREQVERLGRIVDGRCVQPTPTEAARADTQGAGGLGRGRVEIEDGRRVRRRLRVLGRSGL